MGKSMGTMNNYNIKFMILNTKFGINGGKLCRADVPVAARCLTITTGYLAQLFLVWDTRPEITGAPTATPAVPKSTMQ
jgi:hypothetical protein